MEIKVRALDSVEPKGIQELEKELLEKHEAEMQQRDEPQETVVEQEVESTPQQSNDLKEEDVLSYISNRYNKHINSFDELMSERSSNEQLPEDVAAYMKYKQDTGRNFEDFLQLNKDYEKMDQDELLHRYYASTQDGLDAEDIDVMLEEFKYDPDLDDESVVKKARIAKKKAVAEAKKYFNEQKEKYKHPLESRTGGIPENEMEDYKAYKQYVQSAKTQNEENERKQKWFEQKTNEVFSSEFKGFEFNFNDKKVSYAPGDSTELKKSQSNILNFISKFLDENGMLKDPMGYHRALAVAMNPEKFAKFFYEQGQSMATDDLTRKIKNVNMSERKAPEAMVKGGMQVKAVNPDSGKSLKIRSAKRL
jgi:hypothetical protein